MIAQSALQVIQMLNLLELFMPRISIVSHLMLAEIIIRKVQQELDCRMFEGFIVASFTSSRINK